MRLTLLLILLVTGCSAKARIGAAASEVGTLAANIQSDLGAAIATGDVGPKAMPFIEAAMEKAEQISDLVMQIAEALPGVKDVDSWFIVLLRWLPWIVGIGIVILAMVYFDPIVKPLLALLGIIPGVIASKAKIAAEKIATSKQEAKPLPVEDVRLIELEKQDARFKKALDANLRAKGVAT